MSGTRGSLAHRLYTGNVQVDFVGKRKIWYTISGVLVLLSLISLATIGLNTSIDFKGGVTYQVASNGHDKNELAKVVKDASGAKEVLPQTLHSTSGQEQVLLTTDTVPNAQITAASDALAKAVGLPPTTASGQPNVSVNSVGASWGSDVTHKAVEGLIVFLVFVSAYLWIRYEWKMAAAALIALLHDLIIAAGVYSVVRFEVSPATVIASLTILGFSLYDTVVVFDKVRENTRNITNGSRYTYSQAANQAVNQTLMRSINTSIIGLLPVAGLLIIGAGILGAGSLKDLSLPLLIGLAAGTYSSIFIAVPLLCQFKEKEPQMQALARRVATARANGVPAATPALAGAGALSTAAGSGATVARGGAYARPVTTSRRKPTGPRPGQKKRR